MQNDRTRLSIRGWGTGSAGRIRGSRAFTLVEILIVVMILAVLAAIVIPRFQNHSSEAEVTAIKTNLRAIRVMLEQYHAAHGEWPTNIDATWFAGGVPDHPQNSYGVPSVQVEDKPTDADPASMILNKSAGGAYWYNRGNGNVRARVPEQGSKAETLSLYAAVNTN